MNREREILLHFKELVTTSENNGTLNRMFYQYIYMRKVDELKKLLKENKLDPNYCNGECGWIDSNPLNVVARSFYNTYYRRMRGEVIPIPASDVAIFNILIDNGADIHRLPYVWQRVEMHGKKGDVEDIISQREADKESLDPKDVKKQIENFVEDSNRLLEAFLKAGANPDMLGHPYPFSTEGFEARITEKEALEYCKKGTRAINEAIKKGIIWESQVDLLLKYTKLDEDSLKAAEESKDPKMIAKINALLKKQQKK